MEQEIAKEEWRNRGYSSPAATIETVLWAGLSLRERRDTFLECFAPGLRPPPDIPVDKWPAGAFDSVAQATALQVLLQSEVSTRELDVTYIIRGWNRDKPVIQRFRKFETGWKVSGPPQSAT